MALACRPRRGSLRDRRHVPVRGSTVLIVSFTPAATADIRGEDVVPTYTGPKRIESMGLVREVVKVGDFEAQLDWAVGLDARRPFRIEATARASPSRLALAADGIRSW